MKMEIYTTSAIRSAWRINGVTLGDANIWFWAEILFRGLLILFLEIPEITLMVSTEGVARSFAIAFSMQTGSVLCHFIITIVTRKSILKFVTLIEDISRNFQSVPNDLKSKNDKFCEMLRKFLLYYYVIGDAAFAISPIRYIIFGGKPEESLVFPAKFPWPLDTFLNYILTTAWTFLAITQCGATVYAMAIMVAMATLEYRYQFHLLMNELNDIAKETFKKTRKNTRKSLENNEETSNAIEKTSAVYDYELETTRLKNCVKHHQCLTEGFDILKRIFSLFFTVELIHSTIFISLLISSASATVKEPSYFSGIVSILAINIGATYLFCFVGQIFFEFNAALSEHLYCDSAWYNLSPRNQKLILTFMQQCISPMEFFAVIYGANLDLFANFVKLTYRILNILKSAVH